MALCRFGGIRTRILRPNAGASSIKLRTLVSKGERLAPCRILHSRGPISAYPRDTSRYLGIAVISRMTGLTHLYCAGGIDSLWHCLPPHGSPVPSIPENAHSRGLNTRCAARDSRTPGVSICCKTRGYQDMHLGCGASTGKAQVSRCTPCRELPDGLLSFSGVRDDWDCRITIPGHKRIHNRSIDECALSP